MIITFWSPFPQNRRKLNLIISDSQTCSRERQIKVRMGLNIQVRYNKTRDNLDWCTNEFSLRSTVSKVYPGDVEHVSEVVVSEERLVGIDIETVPMFTRQFQWNSLDGYNLS